MNKFMLGIGIVVLLILVFGYYFTQMHQTGLISTGNGSPLRLAFINNAILPQLIGNQTIKNSVYYNSSSVSLNKSQFPSGYDSSLIINTSTQQYSPSILLFGNNSRGALSAPSFAITVIKYTTASAADSVYKNISQVISEGSNRTFSLIVYNSTYAGFNYVIYYRAQAVEGAGGYYNTTFYAYTAVGKSDKYIFTIDSRDSVDSSSGPSMRVLNSSLSHNYGVFSLGGAINVTKAQINAMET